MKRFPVHRKLIGAPIGWLVAIQADWIGIMAVDINRSWLRWGIMTSRESIVVYHGNYDASLAILLIHVAHVGRIWKLEALRRTTVLILWLQQYDGSAIGDLSFSYDFANIFDIAASRLAMN
jgi:hypothetical protein